MFEADGKHGKGTLKQHCRSRPGCDSFTGSWGWELNMDMNGRGPWSGTRLSHDAPLSPDQMDAAGGSDALAASRDIFHFNNRRR